MYGLDAGLFKTAFEDAQKTNIVLSGGTVPASSEKPEAEEKKDDDEKKDESKED